MSTKTKNRSKGGDIAAAPSRAEPSDLQPTRLMESAHRSPIDRSSPIDQPSPWSNPATNRRVLELLGELDWSRARVLDVGAGSGWLSQSLSDRVAGSGLDPTEHVFACDLMPESFLCRDIPCSRMGTDGRLPYPDDHFDAVVAVEVIEHVEDQFAFLREMARVAKPGGFVLVTTPNVLNINSRIRTFASGFPVLFDPLPLSVNDPRHLGGHIHPVSPYFLAYAALRAGLVNPSFHPDRTKKSGVALTLLFSPLLLLGRWLLHARMRRKYPVELEENRELMGALNGWSMLTCRTAVLRAEKAAAK
jgi:2-polyprenyl-3-methyl-5-hydroxy-6-metoxy-1,4-benzoquinol methylase